MGFKPPADLNNLTNTQKQQTVTPDSFVVDDNSSIAATDMYADMLLKPGQAIASLLAHNQSYTGSFGNGLLQSAASKLWFIINQVPVNETADTVQLTHDATPDGTLLRAVILRDRPLLESESDSIFVKLVTDNGGAGNTHFTTAGGLDWLVEDVDATTCPGWQVKFDESGDPQLLIDATDAFGTNGELSIVEPRTGNQIQALCSSGVGVNVYIDPADAEAVRLNGNFASASNKTISLANYAAGIFGGAQVVPIYVNPTAGTQSRLQHAFPFVTDTVYITSNTTNQLIPVVYNASAAADGYRLRVITGSPFVTFAYNNTSTGTDTDTAFYTSTDLTRFQNVKA